MTNSPTLRPASKAARTAVNAVVAGLLIASSVLLWTQWHGANATVRLPSIVSDGSYVPAQQAGSSSSAALEAAAHAIPVVLGYDYQHLADNESAAGKLLTARFGDTYRSTFEKSVKSDAEQQKAITRALVRAGGVISEAAHGHTVRCLLFVDQVLVRDAQTATSGATQIGQSRVVVTMVRAGHEWLVDDVAPF